MADDAEQGHYDFNLDKDFEEIMSKMTKAGWNESTKTKGFWRQDEDEDQQSPEPCAKSCMMEGTMTLVADWFSLEEMKALQGACVLTSLWARKWQYKDFLTDLDDQVSRDPSENWQKVHVRRRKSRLLKTPLCPEKCPIKHSKFLVENFRLSKEVPCHCWQVRVAKRDGRRLPMRSVVLHDVREGLTVRVTILDQKI